MGSGKTTFANYLVTQHGFVRRSFAGGLKAMFKTLLLESGMNEYDALEWMQDTELKEAPMLLLGGKSPRHAMQTLGTEWGRNCIAEDIWVRLALSKAEAIMAQGRSVVFDDLRYINEADALRNAGGKIARVVRAGYAPTGTHASEGQLDSYRPDFTIINDSTLKVLEIEAQILMRELNY